MLPLFFLISPIFEFLLLLPVSNGDTEPQLNPAAGHSVPHITSHCCVELRLLLLTERPELP